MAMVLITLLACQFSGCRHHAAHYDRRLTAADSIMAYHPDSALQLLKQMDVSQLPTRGDHAYYCLLLSQARYRCYVTATSDSDINRALDYYRQHPSEREKLTRSYIYKGAVMEELGEPEQAMTHYKQAMETAAADDAFNQGYVRLRMGKIYYDNYVADSSDITLLKEALHYFIMASDSIYIQTCTKAIGEAYFKTNRDSSRIYLERAEALARQLNDNYAKQTSLIRIADIKMFSKDPSDIETAKDIALSILKNPTSDTEERQHVLMTAAYTLAKQNKADSAVHYLDQVTPADFSSEQQVFYHTCLAEVARCRGDIKQYQAHFEQADHLADSLMSNDLQHQLRDVEAKYDNEKLKYQALRYKTIWLISLLSMAMVISTLVIAMMMIRKKSATRKRQLLESEETIERLTSEARLLESQLKAHQGMSEELKQAIRNQIDVFARLIEQHSLQSAHAPQKFSEMFKKSYSIKQPDSSFWSGLRSYADSAFNGIITRTAEAYPSLNETDIQFLSLYCCDMPTTVIMACMGYNEAHSVYNKKRRITETMSLPISLDDYIQQFKPSIDS